jgi:hypothetical protein
MSEMEDGGPVFLGPVSHPQHTGLSLRDWFAGQALQQAVLDYGEPNGHPVTGQRKDRGNPVLPYASKGVGTREEIIARQAYRYADAMLAARAAKET